MGQAGHGITLAGPGSAAAWPLSSVMPPLGALRTAPSGARAHIRAVLAMRGMGDLADALELVVSELVANGVNASAGDDGAPRYVEGRMPVIRLFLLTDGARLVAEVWDEAPGVPVRLSAGRDDESGRGLDLVDMITGSRWGWHPARSGPGKCVWAEFAVPATTARDGSQPTTV
jgi:Histidine kinase-like ATPase domain